MILDVSVDASVETYGEAYVEAYVEAILLKVCVPTRGWVRGPPDTVRVYSR